MYNQSSIKNTVKRLKQQLWIDWMGYNTSTILFHLGRLEHPTVAILGMVHYWVYQITGIAIFCMHLQLRSYNVRCLLGQCCSQILKGTAKGHNIGHLPLGWNHVKFIKIWCYSSSQVHDTSLLLQFYGISKGYVISTASQQHPMFWWESLILLVVPMCTVTLILHGCSYPCLAMLTFDGYHVLQFLRFNPGVCSAWLTTQIELLLPQERGREHLGCRGGTDWRGQGR